MAHVHHCRVSSQNAVTALRSLSPCDPQTWAATDVSLFRGCAPSRHHTVGTVAFPVGLPLFRCVFPWPDGSFLFSAGQNSSPAHPLSKGHLGASRSWQFEGACHTHLYAGFRAMHNFYLSVWITREECVLHRMLSAPTLPRGSCVSSLFFPICRSSVGWGPLFLMGPWDTELGKEGPGGWSRAGRSGFPPPASLLGQEAFHCRVCNWVHISLQGTWLLLPGEWGLPELASMGTRLMREGGRVGEQTLMVHLQPLLQPPWPWPQAPPGA